MQSCLEQTKQNILHSSCHAASSPRSDWGCLCPVRAKEAEQGGVLKGLLEHTVVIKEIQTSQQGEPGNEKAPLGAEQSSGKRLCVCWIAIRT